MNKKEKQELLIAKLRQLEIQKKVQSQKVQSSGGVSSQWAGLISTERMIKCNHLMKSNHQLSLDYIKSKTKKIKSDNGTKIVLVKRV